MRKVSKGAKIVSLAAVAALAASCVVPMAASAETVVKWPSPTGVLSSKTYNNDGSVKTQQVTSACRGFYLSLVEYLGITDTISNSPVGNGSVSAEGYTLSDFEQDLPYGTYASQANQNPDPYWSNFWYTYVNTSADLDVTAKDADGRPVNEVALVPEGRGASADVDIYIGGTSASFYYRPDIIVGGSSGATSQYQALVDAINNKTIGEDNYQKGDEDYDPYILNDWDEYNGVISYAGTARGNMNQLYTLAQCVAELQAEDSTYVTRYNESAQTIAERVEGINIGLRYYLAKQLDNGTITKKTVAFIRSVDAATKTATIAVSDPEVAAGTQAFYEKYGLSTDGFDPCLDLADVTTNLADKLGKDRSELTYKTGQATLTVSAEELLNADVLFCTRASMGGGTTVTPTDLANFFDAAGIDSSKVPASFHYNPTDLGLGGWQADRVRFMPAWIGYIYPEVVSTSQAMAYWHYYVDHAKLSYVTDVLNYDCASMTLRSGDSLSEPVGGWMNAFNAIDSKITEGWRYFVANEDELLAKYKTMQPCTNADGEYWNTQLTSGTYGRIASRLAGEDRYETMAKVVLNAFDSADTVILATGENYADALAGASIAGLKDAPVILTKPGELSTAAKDAIAALGAKEVIVVGGTAAVSDAVLDQLNDLSVKRISGETRIDTALKIYEEGIGSWGTTAIVACANNFADALAVSPYAFNKNAPIFLAGTNGLTDEQVSALKGFDHVVICGGDAAVPTSVDAALGDKAERLAGSTRIETAQKIAEFSINEGMTATGCSVANANNYPDALAGGAACGKMGTVMLLVNDSSASSVADFMANHGVMKFNILGGTAAVSEGTSTTLAN